MMAPQIIGAHPLEKDEQGRLKTRIGTVFPKQNVLVTLPGMIHAMQREAYLEQLNAQRRQAQLPPLSREERCRIWDEAVDLILEQQQRWEERGDGEVLSRVEDKILIRPDPDRMPLAFAAEELLRELDPPVAVKQVRFLAVRNAKVHDAIKRSGQCWRITPLPTSPDQMRHMIAASKTAIRGKDIYYFNKTTGTRFLTLEEFSRLGELPAEELRQHLREIQEFAAKVNRLGNPEIDFLGAGKGVLKRELAGLDLAGMGAEQVGAVHQQLVAGFRGTVPAELRSDEPQRESWRNRIFAALIGERDEVVPEETMLGLSSEFFMQIEWLPGARLEHGELLLDPCFHERAGGGSGQERPPDEKPLGFIFNFIREFGSLEYVNIGRVIGSLSRRRGSQGRRDVYIAVLKEPGAAQETVKIIRMQKRGVREHLDEGEDLLQAVIFSDDYTEFVLDRRLACRQLRMNLTQRIMARKVSETYCGKQERYHGITILSPYFERDYIRGIATDKLPVNRLENEAYALRFARLLGRAAAPNLILGRCDGSGRVVFDDGDEVVLESDDAQPAEIVLADQMGTFSNFTTPLEDFAADYAKPVNARLPSLACPAAFAAAYLEGFQECFGEIQQEYRRRRSAFDALFRHRRWASTHSITLCWVEVLRRLDKTDAAQLTERIREHIRLDR